jgi:hypothetical protein
MTAVGKRPITEPPGARAQASGGARLLVDVEATAILSAARTVRGKRRRP